MVTRDLIEQGKAHVIAVLKTLSPACLNLLYPGLGCLFELGDAYTSERGAQNLEKLVEHLLARVQNLEEHLQKIPDGALAEKINTLIRHAYKEQNSEKISFYAAVIAGEVMQTPLDWDKELQDQFVASILELAGPELFILHEMYKRKPGEMLRLSERGKTWLNQKIVINSTWLAWIDSLVRKGLVVDVSFEKLSSGATPMPVKSGTAYRLSNFARSMIQFMQQVQETNQLKS